MNKLFIIRVILFAALGASIALLHDNFEGLLIVTLLITASVWIVGYIEGATEWNGVK